ncbi:DUF3892 domain-containing protein [Tsukamurella conjunctivitidis]|uniref:DUF3892 domain-containing protein n=1 Tax=Tsukamurella conjunctivitidis TaxID=2592068 RepID=A0A5C5RY91_9ACTN|nr:DUF3892 domain-containing protein [Tsukamurella conjunctivitidis]TWS27410.1 DUF3892 domain-containing protein [Tsukamurella conjunctivitidis]
MSHEYRITAVHLEPTNSQRFEHITAVMAARVHSGESVQDDERERSLQTILNWIALGHTFYCRSKSGRADVVAYPKGAPRYIRTVRDGTESNNLLELRRF